MQQDFRWGLSSANSKSFSHSLLDTKQPTKATRTSRNFDSILVLNPILNPTLNIELKNRHPPSKKLIQSFIRSPHLIKVCDKKTFKIDGYSGIVR